MIRRHTARLVALALCCALGAVAAARSADRRAATLPDWLRVDYGALLDRRVPSHSGETVGELLDRLGGRSYPADGGRREDRAAHKLLDPLLEPYAFVMVDALDALQPAHDPPWVEVGSLWLPGEAQPAWVELLRARRYVLESDGQGRLRAFVPWAAAGGAEPSTVAPDEAIRAAWEQAWPVLRHALAAERRRLAAARSGEAPPLVVEVHAYRHRRERTAFDLTGPAVEMTVDDTRPDGRRPPLDLAGIAAFLESGLQLEGARLESDGSLRLLGSRPDRAPTLLDRPLGLADLAVAYRAVFHGGLAEPYMSLDRGFFPEQSLVNYGGRLRDTGLGLVSLLCDIRFKTFSLGLDMERGIDRRAEVRERVPEFRTHLERLAADPRSSGLVRQQTRLWFYPDAVDLTVSPQGDVLVLRRVRMSAASERFESGEPAAGGEEAPWTRATVDAINRDYDRLGGVFPELRDLDQVVRLLSLFSWLRIAEQGGARLPELDALLAVELPELSTPRDYPQMIAFNVLPGAGSDAPVLVIDRVPHAAAEARLNPRSGVPLPARRRLARALAALDAHEPQHAAALAELSALDPSALDDSALDAMVYRAGRTRLLARTSIEHYRRLLADIPADQRESLATRQAAGEGLRPITLGIGGLDLDMGQALARAGGRGMTLSSGEPVEPVSDGGTRPGGATRSPAPRADRSVEQSWRVEAASLPSAALPDHGPATDGELGPHRIETGKREAGGGSWVLTVLGADGPEVRSRRVLLDRGGTAESFERVEDRRLLRYTIARDGTSLRAVAQPVSAVDPGASAPVDAPPPAAGLALLALRAAPDPELDPPALAVRLEAPGDATTTPLDAEIPRALLRRVVLGPDADPTPGAPAPALLPSEMEQLGSVMVLTDPQFWTPPWEGGARPTPGEEDPLRIAGGLEAWWSSAGRQRVAVVGVDRAASPGRWAQAPLVEAQSAVLLLPPDGFPPPLTGLRAPLESAWSGRVASDAADVAGASLVVLVSAEAPARFAARLRELSRAPALRGKLLAAWSLAGPIRPDQPAALLAAGNLAGFGLAESSVVGRRAAPDRIAALRASLAGDAGGPRRVERLAGGFVWHF